MSAAAKLKQKTRDTVVRYNLNEKAWLVVQTLALMAAVLSPLWMNHEQTSIGKRDISSVENTHVTVSKSFSITSRVLSLPFPSQNLSENNKSFVSEIETRQIRFERKFLSPQALDYQDNSAVVRAPSSKVVSKIKKPTEDPWKLDSIEKKIDSNEWENIMLVSNERDMKIGSIFVELDPNTINIFRVTFSNDKGEKYSYPMKIIHRNH